MSKSSDPHRQAYAYCAYCPKMCRFSCPVSESTAEETTSTWGKMSTARLLTTGALGTDEETAQTLHACTGCMRCRSYCKHENEVGFALFAARERTLAAGSSPLQVARTVDSFRKHGTPFGPQPEPLHDADAPHAFFPGCASLEKSPEAVDDAFRAAKAMGAPLGIRALSERCCGYPLYAAGLHDELRRHAKRFVEQLPEEELVVMDPGCAYTFRVVYPRLGVKAPPVRTLTTFLSERLGVMAAGAQLDLEVTYHDACHLGRGLGEYDPPRRLLRAAVARVREAKESREDAGCSGGGGLLPRSMPEVSVDVARRQADRLTEGKGAIATACPTSRRMFERAGREAYHWVTLVRRWLEG